MVTTETIVKFDSPPVAEDIWNSWQMISGNPFHTTHYVGALSKLGWQGVYAARIDVDGNILAAGTAVVRTKAGQKWANFFAEPSGQNSTEIFKSLVMRLKKEKIGFIQTSGSMGRWDRKSISSASTISRFFSFIPFGTHEIDLLRTEKEIWDGLHSKHRNSIRSAEKAGVTVKEFGDDFIESDIEKFYSMLENTLKRGFAVVTPKDYFCFICKDLLSGGFGKFFTAHSAIGELISCALVPYSTKRGYYWMGSSVDPKVTPGGTGNLLQWKMMLGLKKANVHIYDLGGASPVAEPGSKVQKIQKFKERFGGTFVHHDLWKADLSWRGPLLRLAQKITRQ